MQIFLEFTPSLALHFLHNQGALDQHGHLTERIVDTLLIALCEDIGTPIVCGGICNTLQNLKSKSNYYDHYLHIEVKGRKIFKQMGLK
jgi:hypothetical protein